LDTDGDGIIGGLEVLHSYDDDDVNNPTANGNEDSDLDGLRKGLEFLLGGDDSDSNTPTSGGGNDTDGDGLRNGLETYLGWDDTDANNPTSGGSADGDGDGIPLAQETYYGWDDSDVNNPVSGGDADADGDGYLAGQEFANGWDDNNAVIPEIKDSYGNIYEEVVSASNQIWLNKNLGASQAATAINDHLAYGSFFQWGREADGHELMNWSSSTSGSGVNGGVSTVSSTDSPGHSNFIYPGVLPLDWRSPANDNLWQGASLEYYMHLLRLPDCSHHYRPSHNKFPEPKEYHLRLRLHFRHW
jgi:hypothetical protein